MLIFNIVDTVTPQKLLFIHSAYNFQRCMNVSYKRNIKRTDSYAHHILLITDNELQQKETTNQYIRQVGPEPSL